MESKNLDNKKMKKNIDIQSLVSKEVASLTPYSPDIVDVPMKLDAMEMPYLLSDNLRGKVMAAFDKLEINRYPDPDIKRVKEGLSRLTGISVDRMIVGNGSDELIQLIFMACGGGGGKVLFPVPTFGMYKIVAIPLGMTGIGVPLKGDWSLDEDSFIEAIKRERPVVIILANPNNPTGNYVGEEAIRRILNTAEGVVVIDEAYYNFSKKTSLPLIDEYPNLIVLRTLSKIGMAGLRVGFMLGNKELLAEIGKIRLPYNINLLSQISAATILENMGEVEEKIDRVIESRGRLFKAMQSIPNITPYPSETNFILFRTERDAGLTHSGLVERGILIRNLSDNNSLKNCLRVTIGTEEENSAFLAALSELVS